MKIIDLLNKIANGEKIKAFKFDEYIFKYDGDRENWKNENGDILSTYCNVEECLNDEIEIIEEEKKIPEKILKDEFDELTKEAKLWKLFYKYNEIIDCINSKGDE